jgi:hypothetical protein
MTLLYIAAVDELYYLRKYTIKYSLYQTLGRQRPVIVDEQILVVAFAVLVIGSEHFLADGDDFRPTLVDFHSPTT